MGRRKRQSKESASVATNGRVKNADAGSNQDWDDSETPSETSVSHRVPAIICALTGFLLYVNAVWVCDFCYDDPVAIEKNRDVLNTNGNGVMSPWTDVWTHDFWGVDIRSAPSNKSYRPLVVMSFRIDALISHEPWIFHLMNALLFAATCWLVVSVMLTRTAVGNWSGGTGDAVLAVLLSGLWFASHPVHTEAVTGIVGRAEVLAAIFCLIGSRLMYCEGQTKVLLWSRVGAAVSFFAACLCKETAVVVPAILAAADIAVVVFSPKLLLGSMSTACLLRRAGILAMVSFAYLRFRVWLFGNSETGQTLALSTVDVNFVGHLAGWDKLRTAIYIQAKYVWLLVWPSVLSCDYSLGVIEPVTSWNSPEMASAALAATGVMTWLISGLVRLHKKGDVTLLLALGWCFGPLIPASHVVGIGTTMAERLLFLPSIGATMLIYHIIAWVSKALPSGMRITQVVLAICIVCFAHRTVTRNLDWENTGRLFATDIKSHPESTKLLLASARFPQVDTDTGFRYATTVQRVLDRHATSLTRSPYPYAKRLMAHFKTETKKWPGANKSQAVEYADQVIAMGNRFGIEGWSWIHEKKGRALIDLAGPNFDSVLLFDAADALKVAIDYRDDPSRSNLICILAGTLTALKQNQEAHEKYEECFRLRQGAVNFNDRRNHAIVLKNLSGVDSYDASAARVWGRPALEAIQVLLDRPNDIGGQLNYWIKSKDDITMLMGKAAKAEASDKDAAKDAILALIKEAEAEASAKAAGQE